MSWIFEAQENIIIIISRLMTYIYIYIYIYVCVCVCVCMCRTAPLTSRCCVFLFIQQIYVLNILNMLHILRFFLFKMPFIS